MAACSDSNAYAFDVASMEVLALLAGLKLAEQIGGQSMMVETDSMEVVQAVLNGHRCAVIIDDRRQLIASLGKETIQHCPRETNGAAHELAHYGASQGTGEFCFEDSPDFLILY